MDAPFPLGLPQPTAFYLTLYVATLVLHALFMNYVLAGSAYLAATACLGSTRGGTRPEGPIATQLRDWLPFALSAAITAGVAPLLFVQVLYGEAFYTANLLAFHRWMAILPALIAGFYLLYVWKSKRVGTWTLAGRAALGAATFAAFAFTAWTWTENHLLSLDRSAWTSQFAAGDWRYKSAELAPRLALWFAGAFPGMTLIVGWQIWLAQRSLPPEERGGAIRTSFLALGGLLVAACAAAAYTATLPPAIRETVLGPAGRPYVWACAMGWLLQLAAWGWHWRTGEFSPVSLTIAAIGWLASAAGVTVLREVRRLATVDLAKLASQHAAAYETGGFSVFAIFLAVNAALIAVCVAIVVKGRRCADASN